IYGGELVPLFRAEWDRVASEDADSPHAQPHWHFVQSPRRVESVIRDLATTREFSGEGGGSLFACLADSGKIHFAMTRLWDGPNASCHKQGFESEGFVKWFDALARYIGGQISYVAKKYPSITEFRPDQA